MQPVDSDSCLLKTRFSNNKLYITDHFPSRTLIIHTFVGVEKMVIGIPSNSAKVATIQLRLKMLLHYHNRYNILQLPLGFGRFVSKYSLESIFNCAYANSISFRILCSPSRNNIGTKRQCPP